MSGNRSVRLIGGRADGETCLVPVELRGGDAFHVPVYKDADRPSAVFKNPPQPPPTKAAATVHIYRLHTIRIDRHRVVYYGIPEHWSPESGLISLFGQPEWSP